MSRFVCGLDIGQARDPTAFCALEVADDGRLVAVRHLEQFPLGLSYPAYVRLTAERLRHRLLRGATLVVDHTGVGRAVFDMFRAARLNPVGITITAGTNSSRRGRLYRVPKRDLATAVLTLMQTQRMVIARTIPHAPVLTKELLNFRVKVTTSANDTYEAWREGDHDDLVLSVACASWYVLYGPFRVLTSAVGPHSAPASPAASPAGTAASALRPRPLSHVLRDPSSRSGRSTFSPLGQPIRR